MKSTISLFLALFFTSTAVAANYPLEIVNIDEVGTYNRINWAYPSLPYETPVVVEGGTFPFAFNLVVAPAGMTIDPTTGVLSWPNPTTTGSPHAVTVRVTDAEGATDTESFSLTIDANRFVFVQSGWGGTQTGAINSPYASLTALWNVDLTNRFLYFRTGTYTLPHTPVEETRNGIARIGIGTARPRVWLAYPGETVSINQEFAYSIGLNNGVNDIYFGNITFDNISKYGSVISGADFFGYYNCKWADYQYDGVGSNPAYLNFMNADIASYGWVFGNDFGVDGSTTNHTAMFALEVYDTAHLVFHGNTIHNIYRGINLKDDANYTTVRNNVFRALDAMALYSQGYQGGVSNTDISFNYIHGGYGVDSDTGLLVGLNHWYRNTLVQNGTELGYWRYVDATDGPFNLYGNVIISEYTDSGETTGDAFYRNGAYFRYSPNVYDSNFNFSNNLAVNSAASAVDSNGLLLEPYRATYLGVAGWETGDAPPDTTPPSTPTFTLPPTSDSLTVPITTLTATDNVGVTGYYLSESATPPTVESSWSTPTTFHVGGEGTRTVYAWARDAAGNISETPASDTVDVTSAKATQFTTRPGKALSFGQGTGQVRFTQ